MQNDEFMTVKDIMTKEKRCLLFENYIRLDIDEQDYFAYKEDILDEQRRPKITFYKRLSSGPEIEVCSIPSIKLMGGRVYVCGLPERLLLMETKKYRQLCIPTDMELEDLNERFFSLKMNIKGPSGKYSQGMTDIIFVKIAKETLEPIKIYSCLRQKEISMQDQEDLLKMTSEIKPKNSLERMYSTIKYECEEYLRLQSNAEDKKMNEKVNKIRMKLIRERKSNKIVKNSENTAT